MQEQLSTFATKIKSELNKLTKTPNHYLAFSIRNYFIEILIVNEMYFIEACSELNQKQKIKDTNKKLEENGFLIDPDGSENYVQLIDIEKTDEAAELIEFTFSKIYQQDIKSMKLEIETGLLEE